MDEQQLMEMQDAVNALMQIRKQRALQSVQAALAKSMEARNTPPTMGYYGNTALDMLMGERELVNMLTASPQARVASGAKTLPHVNQYGHSQSKNVLYRR
jgi:hypothetical protein